MKKIFTLALTLFILNAAFSQIVVSRFSVQTPNFGVSYNRNYGNGYYNNNYSNSYNNDNDRIDRIQHIEAIYEQQMNEIICLPISTGKKIALLRQLKREKNRKLEHVDATCYNNGYNNNYNNGNNQYYDNNDGWRR